MSSLQVGKEVLSHCNKCKLPLAHIIVSMKSQKTIGKVICNTCKATHVYKDPNKVKKKKASTRKTKKTESHLEQFNNAIKAASDKMQNYSLKTQFYKGDLIQHPKFGKGVIEKTLDTNKIMVIFEDQIRTLIHNHS